MCPADLSAFLIALILAGSVSSTDFMSLLYVSYSGPTYWLMMDRRLLPGEDADRVRREIQQALERHGVEDVRIDWCRVEKGPLATPEEHPAVRACREALKAEGLPTETGAVAFGTDAGVFAHHGIPSVVLGPGSIAQAHTAGEFVEIAEVEAAANWFQRLLAAR